jgi:hypothetical protein
MHTPAPIPLGAPVDSAIPDIAEQGTLVFMLMERFDVEHPHSPEAA